MRASRVLVECVVALCLSACGTATSAVSHAPVDNLAVPADAERTLDEAFPHPKVTKESEGLPDLTDDEVRAIVRVAREANPAGTIRSVCHLNRFHSSERFIRVTYEPHEVKDRIRSYWSVDFEPSVRPGAGDAQDRRVVWKPEGGASRLVLNQEVCPPWRSFLGGLPPLDEEIVDLWDVRFLLADLEKTRVLDLVEAVRTKIPRGERLFRIEKCGDHERKLDEDEGLRWPEGAEVYEVDSVDGCGGAVIRAVYVDGRWTAEAYAEWIS